jgi:hypothetical protein
MAKRGVKRERSLLREKFAGTPYGEQFAASELKAA